MAKYKFELNLGFCPHAKIGKFVNFLRIMQEMKFNIDCCL